MTAKPRTDWTLEILCAFALGLILAAILKGPFLP